MPKAGTTAISVDEIIRLPTAMADVDPTDDDSTDDERSTSFFHGFACFYQGAHLAFMRPWRVFFLPAFLTLAANAGLVEAVRARVSSRPGMAEDTSLSVVGRWLEDHWGAALIVPAIACGLTIASVIQPLCASGLDGVARQQLGLRRYDYDSDPLSATFRTAETTLVSLGVALSLLAPLAIITALQVRAWPITATLAMGVAGVTLTWNCIDYPMWNRESGYWARLRWIAAHWGAFLGLGVACSFWMLVPGVGASLLPIGVTAAAMLTRDSHVQGGLVRRPG